MANPMRADDLNPLLADRRRVGRARARRLALPLNTMNKPTKYNMGWIILRLSKTGRAGRLLKRAGWMPTDRAAINNRHGADWLRPVARREMFEAYDWTPLAAAGAQGLAYWITDAQWGINAGATDKQWQRRVTIETP